MKTLVLVNTLTQVNSFVYANHIDFFMKAQKEVPENQFYFFTPHRMSIDRARNQAAMQALALGCDNLMFLDDDVMVPPDTFKKLVDAKKDIIAGLVIIRGMPFNIMAFVGKRDKKGEFLRNPFGDIQLTFFNDLPLEEACINEHTTFNRECKECKDAKLVTLAPCEAVGFSCCMINMDVIRAMEPPYFITGPNYTEDVFFCMKARDSMTPTPEVFLHTGIRCGHLMPQEPVEFDALHLFKGFFDGIVEMDLKRRPQLEESKADRNLDYLRRCLTQIS